MSGKYLDSTNIIEQNRMQHQSLFISCPAAESEDVGKYVKAFTLADCKLKHINCNEKITVCLTGKQHSVNYTLGAIHQDLSSDYNKDLMWKPEDEVLLSFKLFDEKGKLCKQGEWVAARMYLRL
jgi:hypothetical protein